MLVLVMSSLGSIGSTAGAGLLLALGAWVSPIVPYLVSFAMGTLLAGACLGLLPEALEVTPTFGVMTALLVGLLGFFILERLVIWRHCHHEECDVHRASGYLILVGDAFHNFMDGVAIGAAFASSTALAGHTAEQVRRQVRAPVGIMPVFPADKISTEMEELLGAATGGGVDGHEEAGPHGDGGTQSSGLLHDVLSGKGFLSETRLMLGG